MRRHRLSRLPTGTTHQVPADVPAGRALFADRPFFPVRELFTFASPAYPPEPPSQTSRHPRSRRGCRLSNQPGHRCNQRPATTLLTYRSITVPLTRLSAPLAATQARALTVSPTAGIPVPLVEAAVTLPVKSYSVDPLLQPP